MASGFFVFEFTTRGKTSDMRQKLSTHLSSKKTRSSSPNWSSSMSLTFASLATATGKGSELRGLSAPDKSQKTHNTSSEHRFWWKWQKTEAAKMCLWRTHVVPQGTGLGVRIIVVVGNKFETHLRICLCIGQFPLHLRWNSIRNTLKDKIQLSTIWSGRDRSRMTSTNIII